MLAQGKSRHERDKSDIDIVKIIKKLYSQKVQNWLLERFYDSDLVDLIVFNLSRKLAIQPQYEVRCIINSKGDRVTLHPYTGELWAVFTSVMKWRECEQYPGLLK